MGLYNDKWYYYNETTFGKPNTNKYQSTIDNKKDVIINEVSAINPETIEIKNITNDNIDLSNYSIGDKGGNIMKFPKINIKPGEYLTLYGSDSYSYESGKIYLGFHINNSTEINSNNIFTHPMNKL